jgi:hypothetical protein
MIKMYVGSQVRYRYGCQILMQVEYFRQVFFIKKHSDIKFNENPPSGCTTIPRAQTIRHEEANSHFSKRCKRA